mmetsp:Transcript_19582/g.49168  ORF Transcript_19582/g.49168 Transcript_19582/m.49168 type:complete len:244 (+) Transcript_19582:1469-2200(+)
MFHPSGPNSFRSWMTAWKKQSPYSSRLNSRGFLQLSKNSMSEIGLIKKLPVRLERSPFGASFVIFSPFCKMATGNWAEGYEVSHSRYSLCILRTSCWSSILSSLGIHDVARWQFCSNTQPPSFLPSAISFSAFGPCPCPREIAWISLPLSIANLSSACFGSLPGDSTNTNGSALLLSAKEPARSKGGGFTKSSPSCPETYSMIAGTSRSGRSALKNISSSNSSKPSSVFGCSSRSFASGSVAS